MFRTWFRTKLSSSTQAAKQHAANKSYRRTTLGVEALESRALLSATSLVGASLVGSEQMIDSFARPGQVRALLPDIRQTVERDDPFFRTGEHMWQPVGQQELIPAVQKVQDATVQKVQDATVQKVQDATVQKVQDAAVLAFATSSVGSPDTRLVGTPDTRALDTASIK